MYRFIPIPNCTHPLPVRPRLAIFVQNRVKGSNSIWTNFSFLSFIVSLFVQSSTGVSGEFMDCRLQWTKQERTQSDRQWVGEAVWVFSTYFTHYTEHTHAEDWRQWVSNLWKITEQKKKKETGLKKAFRHFGWFLFFKNIILEQTQQKPETPGSGTMEVSVLVLKIMCHMDFQVSMWRMWLRAPVSWKICLYSSASVILKKTSHKLWMFDKYIIQFKLHFAITRSLVETV